MKYTQAQWGRVFILRLEQGDILHETIETFARDHSINAAAVIVVGGADTKSTLVVGPDNGRARPIVPLMQTLAAEHEIAGVGTVFPDTQGHPLLHMHVAAGRKAKTTTGCVRHGVIIWQVAEVIVFELTGTSARRELDRKLGFKLLNPQP